MITLPANLRPQQGDSDGAPTSGAPDEPLMLMAAAQMKDEGRFDRPPASPVESAIEGAAQRHGMDPVVLKGIAGVESSMNPESNRYNRSTQYKGLFQIGRDEWAKYGQGGDIFDANQNADAAARMLKDHSEWFEGRYGRAPEAGELYMMHQQGRGFYTRGAMTNIAGNPYPGMRGPQTPATFEAGWTARLGREMARYDGQPQAQRAAPEAQQAGPGLERFDMRQASPDMDLLNKGIPQPQVGDLGSTAPSHNIIRQSSNSIRGAISKFLSDKGFLRPDPAGDNELSKALGGEDLLRELDKAMLRVYGRRRLGTINAQDEEEQMRKPGAFDDWLRNKGFKENRERGLTWSK